VAPSTQLRCAGQSDTTHASMLKFCGLTFERCKCWGGNCQHQRQSEEESRASHCVEKRCDARFKWDANDCHNELNMLQMGKRKTFHLCQCIGASNFGESTCLELPRQRWSGSRHTIPNKPAAFPFQLTLLTLRPYPQLFLRSLFTQAGCSSCMQGLRAVPGTG
jgi:hypothetical protein